MIKVNGVKEAAISFLFFSLFRTTKLDDQVDDETPDIASATLPDPRQLEWFKKYRMDEAQTLSVFRSLTFFVSFLGILAVVCYGGRDYHQYMIGQEARAILPRVSEVSILPT